jgi:3-oxoacyl-[acyl-carrier protein] reductase
MNSERVACVTGAGSGIGAAIASALAAQGFSVVVSDIDITKATQVSQSIIEAGCSSQALTMDVSEPTSIVAGFSLIEQRYGRCDVLVNNAGIATNTSLNSCTLDEWSKTLQINLTAAMLCSQQASRLMKKWQWGRIINISSISGICASSDRLAYGTSKAALIGLTKQIAVELAAQGITANAIAPGAIETPLAVQFHSASTRSKFNQRIPCARYGQADEVAQAVSFLASEQASYINGQVIAVDGGFLAAGILSDS